MRGIEGCVRPKIGLAPVVALLFATGLLQGCLPFARGPMDRIPDNEMTASEFDDTIAFAPSGDAEAASPPLEVHEIDESQVTAAGGKKVVDGRVWLDADDHERNDILNLVADGQPQDSILVIVVATGDIWQLPLGAGQTLPDGVRPWSGDEYYAMDEDYAGPRIQAGQLTLPEFMKVTAIANSGALGEVFFVHDFGEVGYREIKTWEGFQVALARTWLRETPIQRYLRLSMLQNYFGRLPEFQGAGNSLAFGVMVPGGSVYAMPQIAYRKMIARRALQAWMTYEILGLPLTRLLLDRAIKNTRILIAPVEP